MPLKNIVSEKVPANLRRTTVDIFIPELKIAIEIDGEHHFQEVSYGGDVEAKVNFEKRRRLDIAKENFLYDNGVPLIRLSYSDIRNKNDTELVQFLSSMIHNTIQEYFGGVIK